MINKITKTFATALAATIIGAASLVTPRHGRRSDFHQLCPPLKSRSAAGIGHRPADVLRV